MGSTVQQISTVDQLIRGTGYNNDFVLKNITSATSLLPQVDHPTNYKYSAVFFRLNYTLKNKYLLNLTGRRDGSSRFSNGNELNNYGAIGAGWIFSEENFILKNLRFLSFGKFRASCGVTGNDQIGDYRYLDLYYPVNVEVSYQNMPGLIPVSIANPYLQWEKTRKNATRIRPWIF